MFGQFELLSTGDCLTTKSHEGAPAGGAALFTSPCRASDTYTQSWGEGGDGTVVPTSKPDLCLQPNASVVLPGSSSSSSESGHTLGRLDAPLPGSVPVVLAPCGADCGLNCRWKFVGNGSVLNEGTGTCLEAIKPMPRTCDPTSPSYPQLRDGLCNVTRTYAERAMGAAALLKLEDKAQMVAVGPSGSPYIERLNVKSFSWSAACLHGVDPAPGSPSVTVPPMPIAVGASFDTTLAMQVAQMTATEARVVANLTYLASAGTATWGLACTGPAANPSRDPRWGRVSETFSEDPFLTSQMVAATLSGLQRPNNSEAYLAVAALVRDLGPSTGPLDGRNSSATVDNRTMEDAYLPAFATALAKPAGSADLRVAAEGVSPAYQALNGVPSTADSWLLRTKLRTDFQSDAIVVSEPGAVNDIHTQHGFEPTTVEAVAAAVEAGVTVMTAESDEDASALVTALLSAVSTGAVSESSLNSMVERVFVTRLALGEFDAPAEDSYSTIDVSTLDSAEHRKVARQAAAASTVLLVNNDKILPLTSARVRNVAVVGPNAESHATAYGANTYTHAVAGDQPMIVSVVKGIQDAAVAADMHVEYVQGCDTNLTAGCFCCQPTVSNFGDAVSAAQRADVTVAVVGLEATIEARGLDRTDLGLPGVQSELLEALITHGGGPVVVVLVNGGAVSLGSEVLAKVGAAVEAWYGGEEAGNGIADVLFGAVNPSARLPVTVYGATTTLPPLHDYDLAASIGHPGRTYRYINNLLSTPELFFGFGLSYSTYSYSHLRVQPAAAAAASVGSDIAVSRDDDVWDPCRDVEVVFNVTNSGDVGGHEVTQLYVYTPLQCDDDGCAPSGDGAAAASPPSESGPTHSLQGVSKVWLAAGQSQLVTFRLTPDQLSTVMSDGSRVVVRGQYEVVVGGHQKEDLRGLLASNNLSQHFEIGGTTKVGRAGGCGASDAGVAVACCRAGATDPTSSSVSGARLRGADVLQ